MANLHVHFQPIFVVRNRPSSPIVTPPDRPAIDKLLKEKGIDSVDDVINKAAAEMTPDERKVFEAVRCSLLDATYLVQPANPPSYFVAHQDHQGQ